MKMLNLVMMVWFRLAEDHPGIHFVMLVGGLPWILILSGTDYFIAATTGVVACACSAAFCSWYRARDQAR